MAHGTPDYSPLATSSTAELPTYGLSFSDSVAGGAGNFNAFNLFNPAASGALAKLRRILFSLRFTGNVDGITVPTFVLNRSSTLGTGAGLIPYPHDTNDPPSALSCVTNLSAGPTQVASLIYFLGGTERRHALQPNREGVNAFTFDLYLHPAAGQLKPIVLRPGQGIVLGITPSLIGFDYVFNPEWTEEPYSA